MALCNLFTDLFISEVTVTCPQTFVTTPVRCFYFVTAAGRVRARRVVSLTLVNSAGEWSDAGRGLTHTRTLTHTVTHSHTLAQTHTWREKTHEGQRLFFFTDRALFSPCLLSVSGRRE